MKGIVLIPPSFLFFFFFISSFSSFSSSLKTFSSTLTLKDSISIVIICLSPFPNPPLWLYLYASKRRNGAFNGPHYQKVGSSQNWPILANGMWPSLPNPLLLFFFFVTLGSNYWGSSCLDSNLLIYDGVKESSKLYMDHTHIHYYFA